MSKTARRLGRGLETLVPNLRQATQLPALPEPTINRIAAIHDIPTSAPTSETAQEQTGLLSVDDIIPNRLQPRSTIITDTITRLAASIRTNGLLQPIAVRRNADRYEIIAGERRWRAAKLAGMKAVPVVIREATDEQMLEWALLENIQREDLNAVDRAKAYREYCARFGARPEQLAERLGEDRSTVANYLRLLELSDDVQTLVAEGKLSMGHARCLLGIANDTRRLELARMAVETGISVRGLEETVRRERNEAPAPPSKSPVPRTTLESAHLRDLTQRFEERLKTKVSIIEGRRKGTGRIVIHYFNLDDFDRVAEIVGVETRD